jgi:hypothetical protein
LPPPENPPLREEPELLVRPNPPDDVGLLAVDELLPKERCERVGLESARALAAVFSALGDARGCEMTGWEDLLTDDPALRERIVLA